MERGDTEGVQGGFGQGCSKAKQPGKHQRQAQADRVEIQRRSAGCRDFHEGSRNQGTGAGTEHRQPVGETDIEDAHAADSQPDTQQHFASPRQILAQDQLENQEQEQHQRQYRPDAQNHLESRATLVPGECVRIHYGCGMRRKSDDLGGVGSGGHVQRQQQHTEHRKQGGEGHDAKARQT